MPHQGHRIFEVIALPSPGNILWVAKGHTISIGDFGWENDVSPELIHLTGYSKDGGTIWYANFLPTQVRFSTLKPDPISKSSATPYVTIS